MLMNCRHKKKHLITMPAYHSQLHSKSLHSPCKLSQFASKMCKNAKRQHPTDQALIMYWTSHLIQQVFTKTITIKKERDWEEIGKRCLSTLTALSSFSYCFQKRTSRSLISTCACCIFVNLSEVTIWFMSYLNCAFLQVTVINTLSQLLLIFVVARDVKNIARVSCYNGIVNIYTVFLSKQREISE